MSRRDALILLNGEHALSELPCVGDALILEIELPANHTFGRKCMQCQTSVVRVSKSEKGASRVALKIHKMRFQNYGKPAKRRSTAEIAVRQLLM